MYENWCKEKQRMDELTKKSNANNIAMLDSGINLLRERSKSYDECKTIEILLNKCKRLMHI